MFLWFHTAVCIMSSLFHQQEKSQQILSVSGNSRFWTVLKSLGNDHGCTVADERKHSAGTLNYQLLCWQGHENVSGFLRYFTLSIAYPFDIYPWYCFLICFTLWNFSKLFLLTPVTSINSLAKAVTLRYGKLSQLEKKGLWFVILKVLCTFVVL